MTCEISTITVPVEVLQPFAGIHTDVNASVDAYLAGADRCSLKFPDLYMPDPLWEGISCGNWELSAHLTNIQMEGVKTIIDKMVGTITSLVPELPFPEIPALGITFQDLFPIDWPALRDKVDIEALRAATSDVLPTPIYGEGFSSIVQEKMDRIQAAICKYMSNAAQIVLDMIKQIVDMATDLFESFELPVPDFQFPTLPTLPTFQTLKAAIPTPTIEGLNSFSIELPLVGGFSLGWPTKISDTETSPEYDFSRALSGFAVGFGKALTDVILEYWNILTDIVAEVLALPPLIPTSIVLPFPVIVGRETDS